MMIKIWSMAQSQEKSFKKSEHREVDIPSAVETLLLNPGAISLGVGGPMLLGLSRLYSKKIEWFESKLISAAIHVENILQSGLGSLEGLVPQSASKSARKRPVTAMQTPLIPVPEDESVMFQQADIMFDQFPIMPSLSVTRTPVSSRKRLYTTPRSMDEESVFEATPRNDETDKRRRLSSISDVKDSLRADDGQRRLSGLIGSATGGLSGIPPSPPMNEFDDHFDTGMEPPSPWSSMAATPAVNGTSQRTSRVPKKKSLLDKRGKRGIEIDAEDVAARRKWYIDYKFYLTEKPQGTVSFKRHDIRTDLTSHVAWYVRPVAPRKPKKSSQMKPVKDLVEDMHDDYPDADDYDDHIATPVHFQRPKPSMPLSDRLDQLPQGSSLSVKDLVGEASAGGVSKSRVVRNFVDLLSLASTGAVKISREGTVQKSSSLIHLI